MCFKTLRRELQRAKDRVNQGQDLDYGEYLNYLSTHISKMHSSSAASSALVEYSDVSSEDFSDPEAGEIDSDAALAGRGAPGRKPENQTKMPSSDSVLRITKANDYR